MSRTELVVGWRENVGCLLEERSFVLSFGRSRSPLPQRQAACAREKAADQFLAVLAPCKEFGSVPQDEIQELNAQLNLQVR